MTVPKWIFTSLLIIFCLGVMVPMTSCQQLVGYLIYEWIQNEFNNDKTREKPLIERITTDVQVIHPDMAVVLEVDATDNQDNSSELEYFWTVSAGTLLTPTSRITVWNTPSNTGTVQVSVLVIDTDDNEDQRTVDVEIVL